MMAAWSPVPGYPGYEVSDDGVVRRVVNCRNSKAGKVLKQSKRPKGYLFVKLCANGVIKPVAIHQIVMLAFVGPPCGLVINHKDLDKTNNSLSNLEYVSQRENCHHAFRAGASCYEGEQNGQAKITDDIVREMRSNADPAQSYRQNSLRMAGKYGLHPSHVSAILRYKAWPHVR